jgi:hypothetical protein
VRRGARRRRVSPEDTDLRGLRVEEGDIDVPSFLQD